MHEAGKLMSRQSTIRKDIVFSVLVLLAKLELLVHHDWYKWCRRRHSDHLMAIASAYLLALSVGLWLCWGLQDHEPSRIWINMPSVPHPHHFQLKENCLKKNTSGLAVSMFFFQGQWLATYKLTLSVLISKPARFGSNKICRENTIRTTLSALLWRIQPAYLIVVCCSTTCHPSFLRWSLVVLCSNLDSIYKVWQLIFHFSNRLPFLDALSWRNKLFVLKVKLTVLS